MLGKIEDFGENERAQQENAWKNLHVEKMYDEDGNMFGETIDAATGERMDNSTEDPGAPKLQEVEPDKISGDALPPLPEEEDEAAQWLRGHEQTEEKKKNGEEGAENYETRSTSGR